MNFLGPPPARGLLDQEGFLLQLPGLHLFTHPDGSCTAACPRELWVLTAAVLGSYLAALQGSAATIADSIPAAASHQRELALKRIGFLRQCGTDFIPKLHQRFDRHLRKACSSGHLSPL